MPIDSIDPNNLIPKLLVLASRDKDVRARLVKEAESILAEFGAKGTQSFSDEIKTVNEVRIVWSTQNDFVYNYNPPPPPPPTQTGPTE